MLNEKSCIDCDEFEFNKHNEEIDELMGKLTELEDYDCIVLHKYIDIAHKDKEMEVLDTSLWDIYELVEYADFKNGVDILIDDEGFLNLSVYGQTYKMDGNDNPGAKSQGIKQLMAGGGIVLIGMRLIPLLANTLN
jgi:hypothetical protein